MAEMKDMADTEITADDRLWAALSWIPVSPLWPIISILVLLIPEKQNRPFIRYHSIISLVTGIALIPLSVITCGLAALIYLVFFYWAYRAYMGEWVEIPWVSNFSREQGWVSRQI